MIIIYNIYVLLLYTVYIYIMDIYLDVDIVVTQEFRSSFRLLIQTTELLLTCGRCVLFFDVVEKKLFSGGVYGTAEIQYQPTTQSSEEGAERSFETLESRQ